MKEEIVSKMDFKTQTEFQREKLGMKPSEEDLRQAGKCQIFMVLVEGLV